MARAAACVPAALSHSHRSQPLSPPGPLPTSPALLVSALLRHCRHHCLRRRCCHRYRRRRFHCRFPRCRARGVRERAPLPRRCCPSGGRRLAPMPLPPARPPAPLSQRHSRPRRFRTSPAAPAPLPRPPTPQATLRWSHPPPAPLPPLRAAGAPATHKAQTPAPATTLQLTAAARTQAAAAAAEEGGEQQHEPPGQLVAGSWQPAGRCVGESRRP